MTAPVQNLAAQKCTVKVESMLRPSYSHAQGRTKLAQTQIIIHWQQGSEIFHHMTGKNTGHSNTCAQQSSMKAAVQREQKAAGSLTQRNLVMVLCSHTCTWSYREYICMHVTLKPSDYEAVVQHVSKVRLKQSLFHRLLAGIAQTKMSTTSRYSVCSLSDHRHWPARC